MKPTDLQASIQSSVDRLVQGISAAFAEAFAGVAVTVGAARPTEGRAVKKASKPAKKARVATAAPAKAATPGKRIRRSEAQLLADGERIIKLLAANKNGLRIEQINEQLGAGPKQLARPIVKLLAEGRLRKTGQKRATLYFPATASARHATANTAKPLAPRKRQTPQAPKATSAVTREHILALVTTNVGGMRAEQINKALGTTSKAIAGLLKQLLAEGEIKSAGKARGTVYSKA